MKIGKNAAVAFRVGEDSPRYRGCFSFGAEVWWLVVFDRSIEMH